MDEGRSLTYSNPLAQAIDKSPSQEIVTVSIKKNLGAMKGSTTFIITPKLVEPVPLSGEKIPILIDVPSALQPKVCTQALHSPNFNFSLQLSSSWLFNETTLLDPFSLCLHLIRNNNKRYNWKPL